MNNYFIDKAPSTLESTISSLNKKIQLSDSLFDENEDENQLNNYQEGINNFIKYKQNPKSFNEKKYHNYNENQSNSTTSINTQHSTDQFSLPYQNTIQNNAVLNINQSLSNSLFDDDDKDENQFNNNLSEVNNFNNTKCNSTSFDNNYQQNYQKIGTNTLDTNIQQSSNYFTDQVPSILSFPVTESNRNNALFDSLFEKNIDTYPASINDDDKQNQEIEKNNLTTIHQNSADYFTDRFPSINQSSITELDRNDISDSLFNENVDTNKFNNHQNVIDIRNNYQLQPLSIDDAKYYNKIKNNNSIANKNPQTDYYMDKSPSIIVSPQIQSDRIRISSHSLFNQNEDINKFDNYQTDNTKIYDNTNISKDIKYVLESEQFGGKNRLVSSKRYNNIIRLREKRKKYNLILAKKINKSTYNKFYKNRKYINESRHNVAIKRERDTNGRFKGKIK